MNDDPSDTDLFKQFTKGLIQLKTDTVEPQKPQPTAKTKAKYSIVSYSQQSKKQVEDDRFFAHQLHAKIRQQLQNGTFQTDATLDLHGLQQYEARSKLEQFIDDCFSHKIQRVLIIHGQGHHSPDGAVLKPFILHLLNQLDCVQAYHPANRYDGGKGATYVYLNF